VGGTQENVANKRVFSRYQGNPTQTQNKMFLGESPGGSIKIKKSNQSKLKSKIK